jgi:putative flippase GtrA
VSKDMAGEKNRNRFFSKCADIWNGFKGRHQGVAQFIVFFMLSVGVTVLQLVLMPVFKSLFGMTEIVNTNFQVWQAGRNFDGSAYYVFDYAKGAIANGGGGGLAYFLAVEITLLIAQIINFFAQRSITFKAHGSPWRAAMWYFIAYAVISVSAAALQGVYKAPIYDLLINTWGLGKTGETIADVVTMLIYCFVSFIVFFPIFKVIFKNKKEKSKVSG